jgi:hypothetical protein
LLTFLLSCLAGTPALEPADEVQSAASAEDIEQRVTRGKFPGGLTLALLPQTMAGECVVLALTIRFGSEAALKGWSPRPGS